jgi:quinol monooxygenase YgiN
MYRCECGEKFTDDDEAKEHLALEHSAEIDQKLQEYISDATNDVYDDLITED